jgi:predicted small integral membrane protein
MAAADPSLTLAAPRRHRYNPGDALVDTRRTTEVTDRMTANWAGIVCNALTAAFFLVCFIGIGLGVYAARVLKKREGEQAAAE